MYVHLEKMNGYNKIPVAENVCNQRHLNVLFSMNKNSTFLLSE